jgi:hypothetical protein
MLPFYVVAAHALHDVAENAFMALHGKLNIASNEVTRFSLPRYAICFSNDLNRGSRCVSPAFDKLRSGAVEPLLAHGVA